VQEVYKSAAAVACHTIAYLCLVSQKQWWKCSIMIGAVTCLCLERLLQLHDVNAVQRVCQIRRLILIKANN